MNAVTSILKDLDLQGHGSTRLLDECPLGSEDLAQHFASLPADDLRGVWVSAVLDALLTEVGHVRAFGDIAKALMVVSASLYRVDFKESITMATPTKATPRDPEKTYAGVPAPTSGAGWQLEDTGPLPTSRKKGPRVDPGLYAAIAALGNPPQRLRLDGKAFTSTRTNALLKAAVGDDWEKTHAHFQASDGARIVHRLAGARQ